jgi:hypothetical protein
MLIGKQAGIAAKLSGHFFLRKERAENLLFFKGGLAVPIALQ